MEIFYFSYFQKVLIDLCLETCLKNKFPFFYWKSPFRHDSRFSVEISYFSFFQNIVVDLCLEIMFEEPPFAFQKSLVHLGYNPNEEFEITTNSLGAHIETHDGLILTTLS